jgi:hypothetical protein
MYFLLVIKSPNAPIVFTVSCNHHAAGCFCGGFIPVSGISLVHSLQLPLTSFPGSYVSPVSGSLHSHLSSGGLEHGKQLPLSSFLATSGVPSAFKTGLPAASTQGQSLVVSGSN